MKFGRNQPRSQPIVRVARLEAIPMRVPSNPPVARPLSPNLTVPSSIKSGRGKTTMSLDVSAHISVEACEGGMPEVLSSAIARSQPLRA